MTFWFGITLVVAEIIACYAYEYGHYDILPIFAQYILSNAWATVSTIVHLPRVFPPRGFLFRKKNGLD